MGIFSRLTPGQHKQVDHDGPQVGGWSPVAAPGMASAVATQNIGGLMTGLTPGAGISSSAPGHISPTADAMPDSTLPAQDAPASDSGPAGAPDSDVDDILSLFTEEQVVNEELARLASEIEQIDSHTLLAQCRELVSMLRSRRAA